MGIVDMTVGEIVKWVIGALIALSAIIQISPIKLNPWSWIAKKIGRAVNGEMIEKVSKLEKDFSEMRDSLSERDAKNARTKILRFGDELRRGLKHSKDSFDDILVSITEYESYCNKHEEFKNKITERTTKYIVEIYDRCMQENSFL